MNLDKILETKTGTLLAIVAAMLTYVFFVSLGVFLSFKSINDLFHYEIPFNFDNFCSAVVILLTVRMVVR